MLGSEGTIRGFYPAGLGFVGARRVAFADASALAGWAGPVKRSVDVILGALILLIMAVLMVPIAVWIRLDSPGPVLFRQRRIGLHGEEFQVLKFRTMYREYAEPVRCRQATRHDPRVTRAGALLRRFSADELPQLLNVLRGDMSLVGPRPHAPGTCAAGRPFEQVVVGYAARHRVRPGITGLAQIRGWRGETDTEDKIHGRVQSDLEYIATWSIWLDFGILARTVPTLLRARDVY